MTAKRQTGPELAQKPAAGALQLVQGVTADGSKETEAQVVGRSIVDPAISSALMANSFQSHILGGGDVNANIAEVRRITEAVKRGDLSDLEGMLVGQAIALQTIAANYANRAQQQAGQRNLEAFMGMALKAQAQSRATVQALVDLKFPRQVVFAKNVSNVNNGQQQINNQARAEETESARNKVFEGNDGQWMDPRTPSTAGNAYPQLAAVGEVHRSQNSGRPRRRVA